MNARQSLSKDPEMNFLTRYLVLLNRGRVCILSQSDIIFTRSVVHALFEGLMIELKARLFSIETPGFRYYISRACNTETPGFQH